MRELKIGFLQQHNVADIKNNIERLAEGITDLAQRGAELVILQELHNSLYFCQTEDVNKFDLAETIPGPSTGFYGELANELGIVIVTSLFEKRAPGLYHNTAVVIEKDGSIAGKYRKMHIPDDPAYYEKFYFTPGDLGFHPIDTSVGRLGVLICWDQWYPEAARLMALQGADMLIYPTAIGYESSDTDEEKQEIMNSDVKRVFWDEDLQQWTPERYNYLTAFNHKVGTENRVGYEYSDYRFIRIFFDGDESVGVYENARVDACPQWYGETTHYAPAKVEIIKNDGINVWGIVSVIKNKRLYRGYFCLPKQ